MKPYDKQLVLENGKQFFGYGFGADKSAINEIVFNTSMVGYQEIVSDPSYTDQMVVMTYPLIGNYGMTDEDYETKIPTMGGLIVREYNDMPSNFRSTADENLSLCMSNSICPIISVSGVRNSCDILVKKRSFILLTSSIRSFSIFSFSSETASRWRARRIRQNP